MPDQDNDLKTTVTTVTRGKAGRFVSTKGMDVPKNIDLEKSLIEILKHLVDSQKTSIQFYTSQNEQTAKSNDHLANIENELTNIEKTIGGLYKFFDNKEKDDTEKLEQNQNIERLSDKHLKNILTIEQEQLTELRMLNEQFIDFFEMREKEKADTERQKIEREREAAQPPPVVQQAPAAQQATKEQKKNESFFSSFGSIAKSTFGGFMSFGKSLFSGLGKIFGVLFSVVSAPFKFISSALGSILSFIPGFGIISKLMPSFNMGLGGLLSTLGIGALGYVGFKYLTDDKYKTGVDKYMGGIQKFFAPLIEGIKGFFDTPVGQAISGFVSNLWEKHIKPGLETIKDGIVLTLKTFIGEDNWKKMSETFTTIKTWISAHLPKSYKELSDSVKSMANSVVDGLNVVISFLKGAASNFGISGENFKLINKPFSETELAKTPYTTEGTFTGSAEQFKQLLETSRTHEGGGISQKNKLGSAAAGYHQFMPATFEHVTKRLTQKDFLEDVNKTAQELNIPQLTPEQISVIQKNFKESKDKSQYIVDLDKNIQDLFFIAMSKDLMGTMKRGLGRDVSPFEMKFAGFGTGNVMPIIKAAEKGEQDTTYNVLKRVYALNNRDGKELTEDDLKSFTFEGDANKFYELAKNSKYGNFETLVNQNPNLFYKQLENKKYTQELLKPQETIDQYKKLLGAKISPEQNRIDKINSGEAIDDTLANAESYGSIASKTFMLSKGAQYASPFLRLLGAGASATLGLTGLGLGAMWINEDFKNLFYGKTKNAGILVSGGEIASIPYDESEIAMEEDAKKHPELYTRHWSGALIKKTIEPTKAEEIKQQGTNLANYVFNSAVTPKNLKPNPTQQSFAPPIVVGGSTTTDSSQTTINHNYFNAGSPNNSINDRTNNK